MPHYKDLQNKLHFLDSSEFKQLLPAGCVEISEVEAEEILSNFKPLVTDDLITSVRAQRSALLAACDWVMISDSPFTKAQTAVWKTYRQDLRDVTKQEGFPANVVWPEVPTTN